MITIREDSFIYKNGDTEKKVYTNGETLVQLINGKIVEEVATTNSHPNAIYLNANKDEQYIFDAGNTNSNPIYCDSNFEGCIGRCNSCAFCYDNCHSLCASSCVSCDSCQSCNSCQTGCQISGYGYVNNKDANGKEVYRIVENQTCVQYYGQSNQVISTRKEKHYKCGKACMQCNNTNYSCRTCYTDVFISGGR